MTQPGNDTLSHAQREVLTAIGRGQVTRPTSTRNGGEAYDFGNWRMQNKQDTSPNGAGRVVTATVDALIHRGLAKPSEKVVDARRAAILTADGHRMLSEVYRRAH